MKNKNKIIDGLKDYIEHLSKTKETGYQYKIASYRKTLAALKESKPDNNINNVLKTIFKNPVGIKTRISEILSKDKPIKKHSVKNILASIPGIGPSKATKLYNNGIKSISSLRKHQNKLTTHQKLGLKYYDHLIDKNTLEFKRHPRSLLQKFENYIKIPLAAHKFKYEIAGSYRRKMPSSKDVDIIVTGESSKFKALVQGLIDKKILMDTFSFGTKKWMGLARINDTIIRVDIQYTTTDQFPFTLLYFTGSADFNKYMRTIAKSKGYLLNEYGLFKADTKKHVKHEFKNEKDIFDYLDIPYVIPEKRTSQPIIKNYSSVK